LDTNRQTNKQTDKPNLYIDDAAVQNQNLVDCHLTMIVNLYNSLILSKYMFRWCPSPDCNNAVKVNLPYNISNYFS